MPQVETHRERGLVSIFAYTKIFRVMDLNESKGTLQFMDNPDPPGTKPVNSRLAIHIRDESHLPTLMGQINYR